MATISLVVPAAGCGARAGLNRNKVLVPLLGQPLLWWTLRALCDARAMPISTHVAQLIVAARREEWAAIEAAITSPIQGTIPNASGAPVFSFFHPATSPPPRVSLHLVEGGASRQDSVANAVRVASGDFVLVHDAARPLVSAQVIQRTVRAALRHDCAIAAMPVSDTVKLAFDAPQNATNAASSAQNNENRVQTCGDSIARSTTTEETLDRSRVYLAQTPQIFRREILSEALRQAANDGFAGTDCSSLVERLRDQNGARRFPVALVAGDARNFKITFAHDLERAAMLLQSFTEPVPIS